MTDKTIQPPAETTASGLLEAVVGAELGLRDLEDTCASLEELITESRDLLAAARAEVPAAAEPPTATVDEPPAASTDEPEPEVPPEKPAPEEKPATKRSLEEQAAALRAAMQSVSSPPDTMPAKAAKAGSKGTDIVKEPEAPSTDRRPFLPKRTSPLKSRLAREEDGSPTPQEGESYSDRSAELEQRLRSEQSS
ncbi:MAG: hypothetical protein M3O88_05055 [Actinomycetota bacterium]|nr:hypothetical protein [Actinomycetota bacterium]